MQIPEAEWAAACPEAWEDFNTLMSLLPTESELNQSINQSIKEKNILKERGLDTGTINALRRGGYNTVEQIASLSDDELSQ